MFSKHLLSGGRRVALVHDYLNQFGGAERVVCELASTFPGAPIYTSVYHRDLTWPEFDRAEVLTTWLQHLPLSRKRFKWLLPAYPFVFAGMRLSGYDLVISSSSSFAKGIQVDPGTTHICYCHTPTRFLWFYDDYVERERLSTGTRRLLAPLIEVLKTWDLVTCHRPDHYIANSTTVQRRIREIYHRESRVIFPPVNVHRFAVSALDQGFYLIVSRLVSYKRIDLAVEAFNRLGLPLVVIGDGPHRRALEASSGPNVRFLGYRSDREVDSYFQQCRGFIFPGTEDFGITPLEANACGKPVIAYAAGGALDTIVEGLNGTFFSAPTAEALAEAVLRAERTPWNPRAIRTHAEQFSPEVFRRHLLEFVAEVSEGRVLATAQP
jgi:glycosyltransferase involved in cell wall biosynthesis